MAIIFDVGAYVGDSTVKYTDDPNNIVYAFEPTPYLVANQLAQINRPNFIVVPKAVSNYCGTSKYTITERDDLPCGGGCNSLLEFNDTETLERTFPNHFVTKLPDEAKTIDVEVITLESFIEERGIDRIDYLHCDAQGQDLNVLKGLGKYKHIVQQGVVEVIAKNPLYKRDETTGDENTWENVEKWLVENGFEITRVESNDVHNNELNLWYRLKV